MDPPRPDWRSFGYMSSARTPFVLVFSVLVACSRKDDPTASTVSSASVTSASATAAPVASSPLRPGETLTGLLGREASSRPKVKPDADEVFAAIGKAGVAMGDRKQSVGATYKAAYCTGGYVTDGAISVSVCEYATEADATAGRAYAKTMFPNLDTREVWVHKTNILTIIQQRTDDAARAEQKKVVDAFNGT
jgi:hypothetical protein